jgi:sulfopyruvate decarboxylase TPP-binding subunit
LLNGVAEKGGNVSETGQPPEAEKIIEELKRAGIQFVVTLPDRVTSRYLLKAITRDQAFRMVQVCKEDEGISICSGLYCAGKRALLLIQHTGLLDSINALCNVAVEGQNPVCFMVGLLLKEPGVAPTRSKRYGLRIVEPILDAMGVEHHLIEDPGDIEKIAPAIESAYARSGPVVLLIGREPE